MVTDACAGRVLGAYAGRGPGVRFHTGFRWLTAPFRELDTELPRRGRVLDFGCGHGVLALYLAARAPERTVVGVDVDAAKIDHAVAAAAQASLAERVDLKVVDTAWLPAPERYEAAVVSDVLYVLGPERVATVLDALTAAVTPGGVIVVEETAHSPRWRFALARLQEWVSIRVLRLTDADTIDFVPPDEVADRLAAAGFEVSVRHLDRRRTHPQFVVVARRPRAPSGA